MISIMNNLVKDVDDGWYIKLENEAKRTRSTVPLYCNCGNNDKSIIALFTIWLIFR